MSPRLIDLEDELKTRLAEVTRDRDSMKAWCAAMYAHVCRLTGSDGSGAPQELKAIAESHHAERADLVRARDVAEFGLGHVTVERDAALEREARLRDVLRRTVEAVEASLPEGDEEVGLQEFPTMKLSEVWVRREEARAALAYANEVKP